LDGEHSHFQTRRDLILKRTLLHITLCLAIVMGLLGCATNKNTWLTRGYHRLNTHYNGYFYAREAIKDGVAKIDKSYVDDYSNILPLFKYAQRESLKMASGDMDKAIKKSTSAIERHMITDKKNVEIARANTWVEDCFMTIGQARFYKQEYFAAAEAFEYVTKKYSKWPVRYDGFLWLIRTYNEMNIFSKSEELITLLKNDKKFPGTGILTNGNKKISDLYSLSADYLIKREQYEAAIKDLTKAITLLEPIGPLKHIGLLKTSAIAAHKNQRARYMYVLAQLYEKMGKDKKASDLFAQVARMRPVYDMEFNARLNEARLYDFSKGKGGEEIKRNLEKMLKDFKNEDYRDQIYYTLAGIELREKHNEKAMTDLKLSVRVSTKNTTQKALSYLRMADLYYDRPDYRNAQAYYDSVVPLIKKEFPNYELIVAKEKNLNELVRNLKIITTEDSLQRIAKLDTTSRNAFIDNLIAEAKALEKKKEEEKLAAKNNGSLLPGTVPPTSPGSPTADAGSWYFDNNTAKGFGQADFRKKWGDRKLEDNWRRLNKEAVIPADNLANTADSDTAKAIVGAGKDLKKAGKGSNAGRNVYLKNLPLTKDALDKSNARIVDAYYNAGIIYKEQLMNNEKAAADLEEMLARYPENKYIPTAYYFLYRIYLTMKDQEKADLNRKIILTKYPDSPLAKILEHPENATMTNAKANEVKNYYTETYAAYTSGNYPQVISRCNTADSIYGGSPLSPKFAFLKAMAIGHTGNVKEYESALTSVTLKYPKDEMHNQAMIMLDAIKRVQNAGKSDPKADSLAAIAAKKDKYVFNEEAVHFAVIVLKGKNVNLNTFKTNLSNFNQQYFSTISLLISSIPISEEFQIVNVKEFPDKKGAMTYYEFVKGDKDVFKDISLSSTEVFVMSQENFAVFFHEKNTEEYKAFFNSNYFKKNP
jgi:tetratricopeptide (TPR) repeat protein